MKSLVEMCLFCVAGNLGEISRLGWFLSRNDKESLLQILCDHDMLTTERLPFITYHLFASQLQTVSFSYSAQVTDSLLISLADCGCKLKSFTLHNCFNVTDKGLHSLLKIQNELEYLQLRSVDISDKSMMAFKSKMLSTVILKCLDNITNAGIETVVNHCPNIHELKISRCNKVTDAAIEVVTDTLGDHLEILNLNNVRLITDLCLMAIGNGDCPNLKELHINGCNLTTGNGLKMVTAGCPKLSCLDIGYCYNVCKDGTSVITEKALPASLVELTLHGIQLPAELVVKLFKRLTRIRVLRLCGVQSVDDSVLETVCSSVGGTLIELDLSACGVVTNDGMSSIPRHCKVIESLILNFCPKITGLSLVPLLEDCKRAAEIRVIRVNGCKSFSADVIYKFVMACSNLETLSMAGMKDIDDDLLALMARKCPKLININLKGCIQVSDAGVCEIARLCPLISVIVSGIHCLTDKSVFALTNGCASTLEDMYASACAKITTQAINYLKDCCLKRIHVEHRTPNLDPDQLMALNLDTGEFCRADLLIPPRGAATQTSLSNAADPAHETSQ